VKDVASSLTRFTKEQEQSRKKVEDLQPEKIKRLEKIQMLNSSLIVAHTGGKIRGNRPIKVLNGCETQVLVDSLEQQVEKLKSELKGRELA